MNVHAILKLAHKRIHDVVDPLEEVEWDLPEVCGVWSTKQVVAHLTGWALYFEEFLSPHAGLVGTTAYLDDFRQLGEDGFNAKHGTPAADESVTQIRAAYDDVWSRILRLATRVSAERWRQTGTLSWDSQGSLEDFVVYAYYGHQYEHAAQIEEFHNRRRRVAR